MTVSAGLGTGWAAGILALLVALPGHGQDAALARDTPAVIRSSGAADSNAYAAWTGVVRAIDDPATGQCWLLERDPRYPGGPGRLVLVPRGAGAAGAGSKKAEPGLPVVLAKLTPVIRAGDRLVVEQRTAVVDARLGAIALGPAAAGAEFNARLEIGGRAVRAVALGPGRAAFAGDLGGQP